MTKSFKENKVLNEISFEVHREEVYSRTGAWKSTTINILTAALGSEGGEIQFKNKPINRQLRSYKQALGIVPQDVALYDELSAERNLSFFASLYGLHGNRMTTFSL